jgi:thiopurine S-methyltransferase
MKIDLNKKYWSSRYQQNETGWDLREISPPIKEYIDQLADKSVKILIPGAGNSYEAEYLFKNNFIEVFVLDIAGEPLQNIKKRIPTFPEDHLIQFDFFKFQGKFDLILEQTFFCALPPENRRLYAKKMNSILKPGGKLVGLLFEKDFVFQGPPFGGNKEEYLSYFSPYFDIQVLEPCTNSIRPRMGSELFIIFIKN